MPRLAPLCLAALFALGVTLLVRQPPQRRRQAPSPPVPETASLYQAAEPDVIVRKWVWDSPSRSYH